MTDAPTILFSNAEETRVVKLETQGPHGRLIVRVGICRRSSRAEDWQYVASTSPATPPQLRKHDRGLFASLDALASALEDALKETT